MYDYIKSYLIDKYSVTSVGFEVALRVESS